MRSVLVKIALLTWALCWAARPFRDDDADDQKAATNRTLPAALLQAVNPDGNVEEDSKGNEDNESSEECDEDLLAPNEPGKECPAACPYAGEVEEKYCHFRCVEADKCGTGNMLKKASIPDEHHHFCRPCEVEACLECVAGKPGEGGEEVETCNKCMFGYWKSADGKKCTNPGDNFFIGLAVVAVILGLVGLIWFVYLFAQPVVNDPAVTHAMECRDRQMVLQDHHGEEGQPYPFATNLMSVNVAGPGTTALFCFQGATIAWGVILMAVWGGFVIAYPDLLKIGNRPAITPRQLCEVVLWGRHRQVQLLWTKVAWLAFAYVFSTVGAVWYGIYMARFHREYDSKHATLSDYVAVLSGVPAIKGAEKVEEIIKEAVKSSVGDAAGKEIVAVSVGWNFENHVAQVRHFLEEEVGSLEATNSTQRAGARASVLQLYAANEDSTGILGQFTKMLLSAWKIELDEHEHGEEETVENLKKNLQEMETGQKSFVIFQTETARNAAVEAVKDTGIKIRDATCQLKEEEFEPEAIFWHNLHVTPAEQNAKFRSGGLLVFIAAMAWTVILYLPYAHYMAEFSYANGDEPSFLAESVFIGLVVGAQIGLFIASSIAARGCQMHYEDQKHTAYIYYYNAALILNLVLDICLQSYLSYLQMTGVGAHVADGRLLSSIDSWEEKFESYPMQKSIGKLLFKYCWPCTFLVPFVAEPFVAQLLPLMLGKMLIGRNPKIQGEMAERAVELSEMEQGRYADCIFNMILVACIPFIAPAYMAMTWGTFILSHIYIYSYDHWKTLRYARKFYFSSDDVHWVGQRLFSIPVAILAAALVMKANQWSGGEKLGSGVLKGWQLGGACFGAFFLHIMIHLALLDYVVDPFRRDPNKEENSTPFSEVASHEAATHLTTNPVQCLRSKYILQDSPPLRIFCLGKEHLMQFNPKIGAYFDGSKKNTKAPEKHGDD
eukprot:TRINITY_DN15023_c0_g1_i1.p1 TRINITY_DN15023_c0_g1~~TRINITY_DN15023_c0_g1_i1.p1  ORF type:complete len:948 (+),score=182.05 TRINITY_DN15023_c0_g1_i1:86-2929(+)